MSWMAILVLAAGAYAFKAVGLLALGRIGLAPRLVRLVQLLPAALIAGLIVVQTFESHGRLVVDARAAGVAVGAFAAWRRAPFAVVVVAAALVTAGLRALA